MQQLLDRFFDQLSADGATPAGTLKAYRTDLEQFATFLAMRGIADAQAIEPDDMHCFAAWLQERGYASATIARRLVSLRAFSGFLVHAGILAADPCAGLRPPTVARTPRQALTIAQIDALRDLTLRDGTADCWRDRAILEVLLATALRVSNLVALDLADIALAAATVAIRGRGGEIRTMMLPPPAVMALAAYLQLGRPNLLRANPDEPALFLNQHGERLTRQGCWVVLKEYARQIGLDGVTPELLRQSVAVHRFVDGASVAEVQALLGHAVRKTTEVYQPGTL
jgi:integrase/recombinase XerD